MERLAGAKVNVPRTTTLVLCTLGLSMELNDDILVQTTSLQTIARVKRVSCFMFHKGTLKHTTDSVASFAPVRMVYGIWYVQFHLLNARHHSLQGDRVVLRLLLLYVWDEQKLSKSINQDLKF